jgi:hypothetical protein
MPTHALSLALGAGLRGACRARRSIRGWQVFDELARLLIEWRVSRKLTQRDLEGRVLDHGDQGEGGGRGQDPSVIGAGSMRTRVIGGQSKVAQLLC